MKVERKKRVVKGMDGNEECEVGEEKGGKIKITNIR